MLAVLCFVCVMNLESVDGSSKDVCEGVLHSVLYLLYWWQVIQPMIYSSVVIAIVWILAKAQETEFKDSRTVHTRSPNTSILMLLDQTIKDDSMYQKNRATNKEAFISPKMLPAQDLCKEFRTSSVSLPSID